MLRLFRCLKVVTGENEILVLSDLKRNGFVMLDRFKGLDLEHTELTLSKLAKFHASSISFKEKVRNWIGFHIKTMLI